MAKKIVVDGKKFKSIKEAAHHFGVVSEAAAAQRIAKGQSVKKALTTPAVIGSEVKKRSLKETKVLDQYAQQMYEKNYNELKGYDGKVQKKNKVLNKANSQNWKFVKVTEHEKTRLPFDPKDQAKMVEAFDFKFNFKKYPKYGVPKDLPNGKTNPQYQELTRFKARGFKMWDVEDALTKKEIADVMDSHELPKGVKKWNFLSKDNPKGFRWGVDSKKHQSLSNRIKSTVLGKIENPVAADYASPKGWIIHSMNRVWKNQMKHNNKSDYKPLYNKDKSKIIGFQDNTARGGGNKFYGLNKNTPEGAVSWRKHPDYRKVVKLVDITEGVYDEPSKVLKKLLADKGITQKIRLNDILSYDRFYNTLSETAPSELIKKQIVKHHVGGVGANKFAQALAAKDIQLLTAANNSAAKTYETILRGTKKTPARALTVDENNKLKNMGVKIKDASGKIYGGGYLDPGRQLGLIEKQAAEMVKKETFTAEGMKTFQKSIFKLIAEAKAGGPICNPFRKAGAAGGIQGPGCGDEVRQALQEDPDKFIQEAANSKVKPGENTKFRTIARQILSKLPKGGRIGALIAGAGAVGLGAKAMMGDAIADETGITDQSTMKYNETTGEFVNTETGDPETQTGILNWIADNPGKSGFAALPAMLGAGQGLAKAGLPGGRYLTSWKAAIPAMMIPEKMWQYKQGMEAGEMITDPLNALWALGIENKASLAAAEKWYNSLPEGQRSRLGLQTLKDLRTTQGWKNLPQAFRNAVLSPAAAGTDLAFQKRLKPLTKKLTESIIGSPFTKQAAKKGLGALAVRGAVGLGAAAALGTTVAAGLVSAPLTLGLGALSFGYAQYKDYRDGKAIVDSMLARGKITQEDADNYMSLIKQGSLPFGLGNRLFGDEEMTLRGQTLDPRQQRQVQTGLEHQIDLFQDERQDVRALDRADDFDFFNEGGRVGMKTGGMDRRGFLKWLAGLGAAVVGGASGLFKTGGKKATEQVLKKGLEAGTKQFGSIEGMPAWFPRLISKIKEQGKLVEMADKHYVNGDIYSITLNGKKVTMEQNPLSGEIAIHWSPDGTNNTLTNRHIYYKPGETGFQKYGADPEHPFATENLEVEVEKPTFEYLEPDLNSMGPEDTAPDSATTLDIFTEGDDVVQAMENLAGKSAKELEAGVEIQSNKDFKTHNQTEHQFPDATWDESENITPLADYQYKQTKDPTKKAGGGRVGYADRGLVGTPTDEVTQYDRRVYTTPTGEEVSEKSVTIPMGGMWINIPSIHDGRAYTEDELTEMILRGEIEPTSVHEDREEAIIVATQRSDMMKRHKKGFNTGGEVETGAIARRQSLVPPLAGPTPQGIMGLYSAPKQVRVS